MAVGFTVKEMAADGAFANEAADELLFAIKTMKSDEEVLWYVIKEVAVQERICYRAAQSGASGAVVSAMRAAAEVTKIGQDLV